MAKWAVMTLYIAALYLAGCESAPVVRVPVEVQIPVPVREAAPVELSAPITAPVPTFVPRTHPEASSCLTPQGEKAFMRFTGSLMNRLSAWQVWDKGGVGE